MARIKQYSVDELQKLFASPVEQIKPLDTAQTISLADALQQRELEKQKFQQELKNELDRIKQEQATAEKVSALGQAQTGTFRAGGMDIPASQIAAGGERLAPQPIGEQKIENIKTELMTELAPTESIKAMQASSAEKQKQLGAQTLEEQKQKGRLELERLKQEQRNEGKQTKLSGLQQSNIVKNKGFEGLVNMISELEKSVPRGGGIVGPVKRAGAKLQALFGGNLPEAFGSPEVVTYNDLRESAAVAVYKYLSGDVGNIAATESARALKLVPGLGDSDAVRQRKLALLRNAVKNAEASLKALANDPASANLSQAQLEARQKAIADEAIAKAAMSAPQEKSDPLGLFQ